MKGDNKVKVSARALLQRLNRVLVKDDECLKKGRDPQSELGEFYLIDTKRNFIVEKDVDIEALGKAKGVLKPWEVLSKERE